MRDTLAGPRQLIKQLHAVMAAPMDAQDRLDRIVRIIADNMVAEVSSLYVLRADAVLELYATHGLNAAAVHRAGLRVGEGLVGRVAKTAQPLNITNPRAHPSFAYLPETGEEDFNTFLGVPVLRAGRMIGVLTVQNRAPKRYDNEEVEALQTTAMVIAEIAGTGDLEKIPQPTAALDIKRQLLVSGVAMCEGVGLGRAVLHEPRVVVTRLLTDDVEHELSRLETALDKIRGNLVAHLSRDEVQAESAPRDVLEAFLMIAQDRGWARKMADVVRSGLTAEAAVERVQSDNRARLMRSTDRLVRERLHDLDDIANRLLRELMGRSPTSLAQVTGDAIIVARTMGAAELLDYDRARIRGLVMEEGTPASHVTLIARALGIPTIGQASGVTSMVESGEAIIVDADGGDVHIRPSADVENVFAEKVRFRARRQAQYRRLRHLPAVTRDGMEVTLSMNAGMLADMPHLRESGAAGVGLFRTEVLFMLSPTLPRPREQEQLYRKIYEEAEGRPVSFRSLDIGGDKVLPYLRTMDEENPAMGWRAIRLGLDRPGLLRTQIRALLRASAGRELKLMFPMITTVAEFNASRALVDRERRFLHQHGYQLPDTLKLGVMLETPSLLFELEELLAVVDFVSVGTNDLYQFAMAADRSNVRVAGRFDTLSQSFVRMLKRIADACHIANVPVTVCGDFASRPLEALCLLGIGYSELSMPPAAIGPVKAAIRATDLGRLRARLWPRLEPGRGSDDIRHLLSRFADAHDIPV
ncbi:phosphoenolpyruvate--protein phosphotransferase [Acuticoccus sp. I52.16.1]|uniref:phosphoenolpyruvate--protein phosphotransferase n=1 Tax=Acuticoccus sp. I52.16.1 TaxID=2928472 RepID=UPI001FD3A2D7|nr:phosphoenolpyruvate--protein phosphotransferase [Acuticoccus sp. I52.16.1]UOM35847.1 phosphoenolpyruvate--protein phosphotransferase [Acuticoccus sp. I52.16.1]